MRPLERRTAAPLRDAGRILREVGHMPQDLELSYLRAASQVFDRPLLICETNALMIGQYLAGRMMREEPAAPRASRFIGEEQFDREGDQLRWKGYARTGSVARISLIGELVNRGAWMGASSGLTSYEGFAEQLERAAADDEVRSIVLDVNTPGGEAGGMIETARKVREIAQRKPVHAVVNSLGGLGRLRTGERRERDRRHGKRVTWFDRRCLRAFRPQQVPGRARCQGHGPACGQAQGGRSSLRAPRGRRAGQSSRPHRLPDGPVRGACQRPSGDHRRGGARDGSQMCSRHRLPWKWGSPTGSERWRALSRTSTAPGKGASSQEKGLETCRTMNSRAMPARA